MENSALDGAEIKGIISKKWKKLAKAEKKVVCVCTTAIYSKRIILWWYVCKCVAYCFRCIKTITNLEWRLLTKRKRSLRSSSSIFASKRDVYAVHVFRDQEEKTECKRGQFQISDAGSLESVKYSVVDSIFLLNTCHSGTKYRVLYFDSQVPRSKRSISQLYSNRSMLNCIFV